MSDSPTDARLLAGFESWLRLERRLSNGTIVHYVRTARRTLELVPRHQWQGVDALRPVVESFSLSQRNLARTGARRFAEFLEAKHNLVLSPPASPPRAGTRRVPPSSVVLALRYLVDRVAPSVVCLLTWEAVQMDGSVRLPGGGVVPPHPETLFALAELAAWRPAHAATDALVPGKGGGGAPPVGVTQLRQWLKYVSEARSDATAAAKVRAAFADPASLRFPCFTRGSLPSASTATASVNIDDPDADQTLADLGIPQMPSPAGGSFPDLAVATAQVGQEE